MQKDFWRVYKSSQDVAVDIIGKGNLCHIVHPRVILPLPIQLQHFQLSQTPLLFISHSVLG